MNRKRRGGFTLVELLVVIGIIALLISILLPSLSRARQQANLIYCQANERQIGQLIQLYASSNNGYMPPLGGYINTAYLNGLGGNAQYYCPFTWAEVLTILSGSTDIGGAVTVANNGPFYYHPADTLQIFHDVDTPPEGRENISTTWQVYNNPQHNGNTCDYTANTRAFGWDGNATATNAGGENYELDDLAVAPYNAGTLLKQQASFKRAAEFSDVWDGPVFLNNVTNLIGCMGPQDGGQLFCGGAIDGYACWGGYCLCYPVPYQATSQTTPPINGQDLANGGWGFGLNGQYENPISLGNDGTVSPADSWGGMTLTIAKYENQDLTGNQTGGAPGYIQFNAIRFRHMNNTVCNMLFMDGHVESRGLLQVTPKDISDNLVR